MTEEEKHLAAGIPNLNFGNQSELYCHCWAGLCANLWDAQKETNHPSVTSIFLCFTFLKFNIGLSTNFPDIRN